MIELQRGFSGRLRDQPLTWSPVKTPTKDVATIVCDNGHFGLIEHEHTISTEGIVEPSLVCAYEGCDWHERVRLVGWETRWSVKMESL